MRSLKPQHPRWLAMLTLLGTTNTAFSMECDPPQTFQVAPPESLINVDWNIPVGSVLYTSKVFSHKLSCKNPDTDEFYIVWKTMASNSPGGLSGTVPHTVESNIPGIGIRWSNQVNNGNTKYMTDAPLSSPSFRRSSYPMSFADQFELIKTGEIPPTVRTIRIDDIKMEASIERKSSGQILERTPSITTFQFGDIDIHQVGCRLHGNSSINVNLGRFNVSEFNGVGSKPKQSPKEFTISLLCTEFSSLDFSFAGDIQQGLLRLSPNSTARGLGIQLLDLNKKPINLPLYTPDGNTNPGPPPPPGSAAHMSFFAQYLQTEEKIKPGTANGNLTLTLKYK